MKINKVKIFKTPQIHISFHKRGIVGSKIHIHPNLSVEEWIVGWKIDNHPYLIPQTTEDWMQNPCSSKSHPSNDECLHEKSMFMRISFLKRRMVGWKIHIHANLMRRTVDCWVKNPCSCISHPSNGGWFDEKSIIIHISYLKRRMVEWKIHNHPYLIAQTTDGWMKNP
jgi:hypothetical protein